LMCAPVAFPSFSRTGLSEVLLSGGASALDTMRTARWSSSSPVSRSTRLLLTLRPPRGSSCRKGEKLGAGLRTGRLLSYIGEVPVQDRRLGFRIPFETMITSYVHDRPVRGLATNLSDSGLSVSAISMLAPPPGMIVGLELDVP